MSSMDSISPGGGISTISRTIFSIGLLSGPLCSCISFALPQPRSSRIAAAAMRFCEPRGTAVREVEATRVCAANSPGYAAALIRS